MRGCFIAFAVFLCLGLCAPTVASAQSVTLKGWTDDGKFVVEVQDPVAAWGAEWMQGADDTADFWGVCTPQPVSSAQYDGDGACQPCKDAASCGLTVDGSKVKAAKKSPNKKVKLTDKRKCRKDPEAEDPSGKTCTRTLSFGKVGKVSFDEAWSKDKAKVKVFFRKDSKAALVTMDMRGRMDGVDWSSMYVLDFGGGTATTAAAGYTFRLDGLTSQVQSQPSDDDPVGVATGTVQVTLTTPDGKSIPVDTLDLYSHGAYGLADALSWSSDNKPSLNEDLSSETAAGVKAHLPKGTIAVAGYVNNGDRATFQFVVYAVAKNGDKVTVVRQVWQDGDAEPNDENRVDL
jgi:hypothetical protein